MFFTELANEFSEYSHVAFSDAFWLTWIFFLREKKAKEGETAKFTHSSTDSDLSKQTIALNML